MITNKPNRKAGLLDKRPVGVLLANTQRTLKQVKIPVKIRTLALPKFLRYSALELEARVGIGQRSGPFQTSPKPFGSGYFSKCCTDKEINRKGSLNQANNSQHGPAIPRQRLTLLVPVLVPASN